MPAFCKQKVVYLLINYKTCNTNGFYILFLVNEASSVDLIVSLSHKGLSGWPATLIYCKI